MCEGMDFLAIILAITVTPKYDTNVELRKIPFVFNKRDYSLSMPLYFCCCPIIHL